MGLGLGRWTVERVGSRVREMADSVREMADNLPRTQMPAVRMPPWVRLPEVKMTPAPRRGVHPLWVVAGASRDMMSRARGLVVELRSKVRTGDRREPWAPETSSEARRS